MIVKAGRVHAHRAKNSVDSVSVDKRTSPCSGYVLNFYEGDGLVKMTYAINCSKKVDKIQLKAFLREGDRWSQQNIVTCRNVRICTNAESLRDRAGSESYFARAFEGHFPPSTYVQHNGNTWICNAPEHAMPCGGAGNNF